MLNICIQNLGLYNEGILCFKWLTLPATEEEIDKALTEIRISHTDVNGKDVIFTDDFGCPYEEMHIADWECDIDGIEYSEWETIEHYNEIAEKLETFNEVELHWLSAYMEDSGESFENAIDEFQELSVWYEGQIKSDVAREQADEEIDSRIPRETRYGCDKYTLFTLNWFKNYFDYEQYERELDLYENSYGTLYRY